jgi:hypothetical protein
MKTCPKCKSEKIATIVYGYPADEEEFLQLVAEKKIVPGGCCIGENDPKLECTDCNYRW